MTTQIASADALRPHAEVAFAAELAALERVDDAPRPPRWRLSPRAVVTYLLGGDLADGTVVSPKYIGSRRLMEVAVATLATDRALLLLGVPGTAKSWVSEHLAAAISGDSTRVVQGTAGTGEEAIRYGWNYARLLAEGPSEAALVASPVMTAMREGSLARIEELTRIPADVQDALITALSEKVLPVPELGVEVAARKGFNLIATANDRDRGVNELSSALRRRFNTVVLPLPSDPEDEVRIVSRRVADLSASLELPEVPAAVAEIRRVVTVFRELRSGVTSDGRTALKSPSGTLSAAEAISVITSGISLSAHFGDATLRAGDVAAGIRHHGPGSARSMVAALEAFDPDAVLVEGPADANPLLPWAVSEQTEPPVALLAYAADAPGTAAFWPFAVFSPEWQAITWAQRRDLPARFCDLPAAVTLARRTAGEEQEPLFPGESEPDGATVRGDPLSLLAAAAGYDDAERWWDDVVESRLDGESPFPALTEAMATLRSAAGPAATGEAASESRREAYMRQTIRAAVLAGHRRVAVVCGAWHAPALTWPLPPASGDVKILRGMAKRKVRLTWVPWTHSRLAYASGYGAGITSPGWYHHLWIAPDRPVVRWLTRVAGALRHRDLPVSSAHVIEAVRLADSLAALRGRPLAGLAEVTDATRAVLCEGDEAMVQFVTNHLVIGQALGRVDEAVPTVPLEADLLARCRTLRIRREPDARPHDLDLRKPFDRQKSVLFHRLRALGLPWITPAESEVQGRGTFREVWTAQWRPEYALAVVEASVFGTTVPAAATAKVSEIVASGTLLELTTAIERCLLAELPVALGRLLAAVAERAARDVDVGHLMEALTPLARACRYGDVRGTDTAALAAVAEVMVVRICAGLPQALGRLDDDAATALRRQLDRVQTAIALLGAGEHATAGEGPTLQDRWLDVLRAAVDRPDVSGLLVGRMVRILL